MKRESCISILLVLVLALALTGCRQRPHAGGTAAGAVTGGVLGGVVGNNVGDGNNTELGAAIGAVAGGVAGNAISKRRAQQQQQIHQLQQAANTHTVAVSNANGSTTPVTLTNIGNGQWRGPRGEIYNNLPTEVQLKGVYGI